MISGSRLDEARVDAALLLLGHFETAPAVTMSEEQRLALAEMTEMVAAIGAGAVDAVAPPPSLRDRLLERLDQNPYPGLFSKRANQQGAWKPSRTPGISYKKLYKDPASGLVTMLVKLEPGARFGEHAHTRTEQCLVLEGDLRYSEEKVYRAGDFTWAEAGSIDPALYTVEGATLLIVGEP